MYYVEVTRLLLLFTGFFLFLYLPLFFSFLRLVSATLRQDVTLMYDSLCLSRSCLASFRCPAVSVCVCASRSFSALFLRVPHRGCIAVCICQTVPILQLLCSMWKFAAVFCLSNSYIFGSVAYQVSCSVSVSFLQPYA